MISSSERAELKRIHVMKGRTRRLVLRRILAKLGIKSAENEIMSMIPLGAKIIPRNKPNRIR